MKKTLLRVSLCLLAVYIASKAFIALFGYQIVENLKLSLQQDYAISYDWISSDLNGSLILHGLEVTPYSLKRSISIRRLELFYSDYLQLLLGLPELKAGSVEGFQQFVATEVSLPLEGRDVEQLFALRHGEQWLTPLGVYACGDRQRIDHDALKQMGLDAISARVVGQLSESASKNRGLSISLALDLYELGQTNLKLDLASTLTGLDLRSLDLESEMLHGIHVQHIERGYFRRLSNFCIKEAGLESREVYAQLAAREWRTAMRNIGVQISDSLVLAYQEYLHLGGGTTLTFRSPQGAQLKSLYHMLDVDLISELGIEIKLNEQLLEGPSVTLLKSFYQPAPAIEVTHGSDSTPDRSRPKLPVQVPLSDIDLYLGQQLKVSLQDGKVLQGQLRSSSESKVEIYQSVSGGGAAFVLKRSEIIDVQRVQ